MVAESGQLMADSSYLNSWIQSKPTPLLVEKKLGESIVFEHILFNLRNPILTDVNVRKALLLSIDRKSIIEDFLGGNATLADSNVHPKDPLYSKREDSNTLDTKTAIELLDKSGWDIADDGIRRKDGDTLKLEISTLEENSIRSKIIDRFVANWKKIGIQVVVSKEKKETFFENILRKSRFTGMIFIASEQKADILPIPMLDSREIPTNRNKYVGQNSGAWSNEKVDRNFDRLKKETKVGKRKKLMAKILQEFDKDIPMIPLFFTNQIAIIPQKLENFSISGHQFPSSLGAANWKLKM